jgi:hypothetical protein
VSSSLIRQDLVPMIVGYVLIMGALAIGLRIVQRSGKAGAATGAGATTGARATTDAGTAMDAGTPMDAGTTRGAAGSRRPAGRPPTPLPTPESRVTDRSRLLAIAAPEPGWRRLAVFSLSTAVGGYLVLMAVIIAYYVGIGVPHSAGTFVPSAFSGCAMLIGLAAPVFAALSWLAARKGWRI